MPSSSFVVAVVAALLLLLTTGGTSNVAEAQYMPDRQPGTLLLNMLIKNERDHLDRTLPAWAKIIDYWIIGVDDANTDDSAEVIQKHLGHIPGRIVIVHFDGMGPTWSVLVQAGIDHYPEATHGIISDADFKPMKNSIDKMELDVRCSKHMYTIWTSDHRNERKMDWIYRNIQGARVKRRTHQILEVPRLPNQEVFQTLIDLPLEEREGGYQDRTGNKNERYIGFLEADLREYPNDTRTLYYLGYAHFDIYAQNAGNPQPEHYEDLETAISYFKHRLDISTHGNPEEKWFAVLKLGEIYERFKRDWNESEKYYELCVELDPERADAWFYLGQHYRLTGDFQRALPLLHNAAVLPPPERSLFQWHYLYDCLGRLELGRLYQAMYKSGDMNFRDDRPSPHASSLALRQSGDRVGDDVENSGSDGSSGVNTWLKDLQQMRRHFRRADCTGGDAGNVQEMTALLKFMDRRIKEAKKVRKKARKRHAKAAAAAAAAAGGGEAKEVEEEVQQQQQQAADTASKSTPKSTVSEEETGATRVTAVTTFLKTIVRHYDALQTSLSTVRVGGDDNDDDDDEEEEDASSSSTLFDALADEVAQLSTFVKGVKAVVKKFDGDRAKAYSKINCRRYRAVTKSFRKFHAAHLSSSSSSVPSSLDSDVQSDLLTTAARVVGMCAAK